ncbi:permease [Paracoccus luteus]|uniref:permease n=1 Tax=Paracoccus luteus TaxID=2508543 RepID=UPI00106F4DD4|nr:permease [Paracoccus luteus]
MDMSFDPGPDAPEGPFTPDAPRRTPVVDLSEGLFHAYADDLEQARKKVLAGEFGQVKDSAKLARDLRDAAQLVLEERNKVDKLRKDVAGTVGEASLDLAAARDEIGRRLACLRRAGGG